ncbi:MAG: anti-sigma factor family protein [Spirochaetaceae bacterium]
MCEYEKELSAYMDGELSSEERAGIEEHVKVCGECSERLESLKRLSGISTSAYPSDSELHTEERMERSMHRIVLALERNPKKKIWEGRLSLTFPGAAAAALLLFLLGGLVTLGTGFVFSDPDSSGPDSTVSQSASSHGGVEEIGQTVSTSSGGHSREEMEELFRFLSDRGASVEIKIELPTPSNFNVYGEPQLIRATDFAAVKESSVN